MRKQFFTVMMLMLAYGVTHTDAAAPDTIIGTVSDSIANTPIDSVSVSSEGIKTTTNASGNFKLVFPVTGIDRSAPGTISWDPGHQFFSLPENQEGISMEVNSLSGRTIACNISTGPSAGLSIAHLPQGVYLASIRTPWSVDVFKIMKVRTGAHDAWPVLSRVSGTGRLAKSAATGTAHIVVFSKAGYAFDTLTVPVNTSSSVAIAVKLFKPSNFIVLFDGTSLDNWVVDPAGCSIKDGSLYISGCTKCMMWSKGDYDNFRLFIKGRITSPDYAGNTSHEHIGLGVWGARRSDFLSNNTMQFTLQNCWTYDFVNGSNPVGSCGQPNSGGTAGWDSWKSVEFLFIMTTGTVKSAVDGVLMDDFKITDLSHLVKGPFGLQKYGAIPVEYKDIKVELDPKDTNLVSLKQ